MKLIQKNNAHNRSIFIAICLISSASLALWSKWPQTISISAQAQVFPEDSFRSQARHPLKLILYSKFDKTMVESMRASISRVNRDSLFSDNVFADGDREADALVFFVDGWSDVALLPDQGDLAPIYKIASTTDHDAVATSMRASANGRPIMFVFYNLVALNNKPPKCFAEDLVNQFTAPEQPGSAALIDCGK